MECKIEDKTDYPGLAEQVREELSQKDKNRFVPMEERRDTSVLSVDVLRNLCHGKTCDSYLQLRRLMLHKCAINLNNCSGKNLSRENTDVVFLDLSKAFDSVPRERLLLKLNKYGIDGPFLLWFRHFLTNRQQRVGIRGTYSNWSAVTSGVPQGLFSDLPCSRTL